MERNELHKISLAGFIEKEVERLNLFDTFWRQNHDENPSGFPLEMEPGEWDEQLHLFNS